MDLNRPLGVITPTIDAEVLSVLAGAEASFTGLQVQVVMGSHTQKAVWSALQRLSKQGVVVKEQKGQAGLYSLNREHLAAPYITGLANLKNELLIRVTKTLSEWEIKPVFAAIFGSAARGGMRLDSDIDIFIVRPDTVDPDHNVWATLQATLSDSVTKWTGNDARVFELSESEVQNGSATNDRVLTEIRDQAIVLLGERSILQVSGQIKRRGGRYGK